MPSNYMANRYPIHFTANKMDEHWLIRWIKVVKDRKEGHWSLVFSSDIYSHQTKTPRSALNQDEDNHETYYMLFLARAGFCCPQHPSEQSDYRLLGCPGSGTHSSTYPHFLCTSFSLIQPALNPPTSAPVAVISQPALCPPPPINALAVQYH